MRTLVPGMPVRGVLVPGMLVPGVLVRGVLVPGPRVLRGAAGDLNGAPGRPYPS
ncbi:hypothetical protein [Nonomuraea candida]|uniref:hypothetical protein n=1 Tax=Nonomuraea candida TaxID=359159 RepID=UPI000AD452DB|nr:hypothetical protein [Nonomuraea candida]